MNSVLCVVKCLLLGAAMGLCIAQQYLTVSGLGREGVSMLFWVMPVAYVVSHALACDPSRPVPLVVPDHEQDVLTQTQGASSLQLGPKLR